MSKIVTRIAAVALGASLSVAGAATAAQADTESFTDPKPNLTRVTVSHGSKNVKVTARTGKFRIGSYFTVYLDTDPRDPGPEYRNDIYPNSEVSPLKKVEKFGQKGKTKRCDGLRATADVYGPREVTLTVPRSCLGRPAKVRVAVRGYYDVKGPNVIDWAPGYREFTGWVHR
jgi:hypothetical protein